MTIGTTAIPAGWYRDPAGTSALRWWDGNQWTDHLQQSAPIAPQPTPPGYPPNPQSAQAQGAPPQYAPTQLAPAAPEVSRSSYSPVTGYSAQPRNNADPYSGGVPLASVQHNNSIAWVSFVAGIVSLATLFVVAMFPGNYFFPFFGLTAILSGIRAISRYRSRRVTALWAPIIGIVFGGLAELILIASFIIGATASAAPFVPVTVGPTGATINYDMGSGTPQYLPTSNGTLTQVAMAESVVVNTLQADYANGKTGAAANGSWPSGVLHTATGDVNTSDGRDLGHLLGTDWHLAYTVNANGSYSLLMSGPDTAEVAFYNSADNEFFAWCQASDETCKTNSPALPITGPSGNGTATTTPPTTT